MLKTNEWIIINSDYLIDLFYNEMNIMWLLNNESLSIDEIIHFDKKKVKIQINKEKNIVYVERI